jgi:hypothetical protein
MTELEGPEEPTVAKVRAIYDQMVAGSNIPRFGKFYREQVGVLLAEIDRLNRRIAVLEAGEGRRPQEAGEGRKRGPRQRRVGEDYRGASPP